MAIILNVLLGFVILCVGSLVVFFGVFALLMVFAGLYRILSVLLANLFNLNQSANQGK